MKRRTVLASTAAALAAPTALLAPAPARAQGSRIVFGFTAVTDFSSVFVAAEEGYFKKRGLEVELKFIPINSTIPAALQADSLQIGGPTPSVYLQGVDGGLDHVVVAGGGATSKSVTGLGLLARAGSGIKTAQDCVGRKIGVPGLGAFLHVTFRAWLKQNGVDHRKVNFVEAAFPQHGDLLKGGTLDAVVSADPFMRRIADSGVAYVASYYSTFLPDGLPTIIHTARREWADKHPAQVKAFREAVVEAAAWMGKPANDAALRAHIGKYIKLPPEVLAKVQIAPPSPLVTSKQLDAWVALMKDQEMLKTAPNTATLIAR
ncbi:MAG: ABC transporter substrate-binding protein [Burkholderiales bacterium]|nr:ABC transporter substrate-binding protein [Burkholderiales bacterium]